MLAFANLPTTPASRRDYMETTAPVCIRRLFSLRSHPRDGERARREVRAWIRLLRLSRQLAAA